MSESQSQNLGAIIKKARKKKGLSLTDVASALRIKEDVVLVFEEERYDQLPSLAYGRMYLKMIATHLDLDSGIVLLQYAAETGLDLPDPEKERHGTMTMTIQQGRHHTHWGAITAGLSIALLLFFYLIGNDKNRELESDSTLSALDTLVAATVGDSLPASVGGSVAPAASVVASSPAVTDTTALVAVPDSFEVALAVTGSTWLEAFVDGKRREVGRTVQASELVQYKAADSIHIKVGNNSVVRYKLDGKPQVVPGKALKVVRFSKDSVGYWRHRRWKDVFADVD